MPNNVPNKSDNTNFSIMSVLAIIFKFFSTAIVLLIMLFVAIVIYFIVAFDNCWNFTIFKITFFAFTICLCVFFLIKNNSKSLKLLKICKVLFIVNIINIFYYVYFSTKFETSLLLEKYNIPKSEVEIEKITNSSIGIFSSGNSRRIKYNYNGVQFSFWYSNDGWVTDYEESSDFEKNNKQNVDNINKYLSNYNLDYYVALDYSKSYYLSNQNSFEYDIFLYFKVEEAIILKNFFTYMNNYISNQRMVSNDYIVYNTYFVNDSNIFSKMINNIEDGIGLFNNEEFLSNFIVGDVTMLSNTEAGFDISIFNNYANLSNIIFYYRSEPNGIYHPRFVVYGAIEN